MPKPGLTGSERAAAPTRPIIPNEIFLEIFSYIQASIEIGSAKRRHILSQLSLVCTFFWTALRPRLFEWLILSEYNHRSAAFCQALIHGDVHALALTVYIRACVILHPSAKDPDPGVAATSAEMYHQVLRWAPNVEHLQIYGLNIDTGFWRAIAGLSKLRTLILRSGSFRGDILPEEIDRVAGLRVSSLTIWRSQLFCFNPATLSELCCSPNFLDTLLASGPIDTLETLIISPRKDDMWSLNILSKVPSVRNLTIDPSAGVVPQSDFPPLLPNLCSLTCQFSLLFLASGRPLVSLHVWGKDYPALDLGTILGSHGLNTITDLHIPSIIYLTTGHCFPHLRSLRLEFPWFDELETPGPRATAKLMTLVDSCSKWAVNPAVQRLRIAPRAKFPLMDLALQHTMLSGSLSRFSALRWFQLGEFGIQWERFAEDEAWRVPAYTCHQGIIKRFKAGDPCVVDYDGYLQRLSARDIA